MSLKPVRQSSGFSDLDAFMKKFAAKTPGLSTLPEFKRLTRRFSYSASDQRSPLSHPSDVQADDDQRAGTASVE